MAQTVVQDFVSLKFNVGAAVASALDSFGKERSRIQDSDEADFQNAVASNTLSPDAQVSYRQQMLDKAQKATVPDLDYITNLKSKLASSKKLARNANVIARVKSDQAKMMGGLQSSRDYLQQLQDMLGQENDPDLQAMLGSEIVSTQGQIFTQTNDLINQEFLKGKSDDSTSELNKALADAQDQKAKLLANGDVERAGIIDTTIGAISQQIVNVKMDFELNGVNINKAADPNPLSYVNALNDLIQSADGSTPIQYKGITSMGVFPYASEKAYLQELLTNFISTKFIGDLTSQYSDYIKAAQVQGTNGMIPQSVLDTVKNEFAQLSANPTYTQVADRLAQTGVQVLGAAVKMNAEAIVNNYKAGAVFQTADQAMSALNNLSTSYGIDTSAQQNDLTTAIASEKSKEANSLNSYAVSVQNMNPGMSFSDAMKQAITDTESGKAGGVSESPTKLATKSPAQIVKPDANEAKTQINSPGLTVAPQQNQPPQPVKSPAQQGQPASSSSTAPVDTQPKGLQFPAFSSFVKTPNNPTVYGIDSTGQHVAFENQQQFEQSGGNSSAIKTVTSAPNQPINYTDYLNKTNPNNFNPVTK